MTTSSTIDAVAAPGYTHTAFFYDGVDELIPALVRFVRAGIDADEHVLVVVDRVKGALLVDQPAPRKGSTSPMPRKSTSRQRALSPTTSTPFATARTTGDGCE